MTQAGKPKGASPEMGLFTYDVFVGHLDGGQSVAVRATVDTGSIHSMLPASLLAELNVTPLQQRQYTLADRSRREYGFGYVNIAIDDVALPCPVIFGPDDKYLLGATTLEAFELMVDPVAGDLVPREIYTGPI